MQSEQSTTAPQSSDESDDVEVQSAELRRTEMKLIRQIESIQEERSLSKPALYCYLFIVLDSCLESGIGSDVVALVSARVYGL